MSSLNKYVGTWTPELAAHLLRRATFGASIKNIKAFAAKSMDECIENLFIPLGPPPPPLNLREENDPDCPIGQTWVDKGTSANVNGYRDVSLRAWSIDLMITSEPNIREKMTLFWHNHFVTADINDPRYSYIYISLLRANALGNFKQLTKDITVDPSMLNYLNGRDNTRQAPNENYARELMELFTLGKGELAGPGDYTTFTEEDVKQMAKALTGWQDVRASLPIKTQFVLNRHDTTDKRLSHRFNNVIIKNAGADEYKNVVDLIFERPEVSLFIARKLYIWFVNSDITADIESDVIVPLAKIIKDNNYNMIQGVKALLSSEHFYDECIRGQMVKNPIDFIIGPVNQFALSLPPDAAAKEAALGGIGNSLYRKTFDMQMAIFQAPSVAGWQAYYQEPNYYKLWLNSTSLPARKNFTDGITSSTGLNLGGTRMSIDVLITIDNLSNPSNVDNVVSELVLLLFSNPVDDNQKLVLKNIILAGGTSENWTSIYNRYINNPTVEVNRLAVVTKVRPLLQYMMRMPEFHLS